MGSFGGGDGGGGVGDFLSSPAAMILMPRTSARFRDMQRENYLLEQARKKQQFAAEFARSIEKTDPLNAAAIMADPSVIDNVLVMYNQKAMGNTNFEREQQAKREADERNFAQQKELEAYRHTFLQPEVQQHQELEKALVTGAVQPTGAMANPKIQGPRPEGQLQQGQNLFDASPRSSDLLTKTIAAQTGIEDLTPQEALQIMLRPSALAEVKQNRLQLQQEKNKVAGDYKDTVKIYVDGKERMMAFNPETKRYDIPVGEVAPDATAVDIRTRTKNMVGPDGKEHIFSFNPETGKYDVDQGLAMPPAGTPTYDKEGNITGYVGGAGPKGPTEAQQKGISLYESAKDQFVTAIEGFDDLTNDTQSKLGARLGEGGRFIMSGPAQVTKDSITQVAQNYIYALSGQQAPEQEVERISALVMPSLSDKGESAANKKRMLYSMMRAIKARLPANYKVEDKINKIIKEGDPGYNPSLRVQDPTPEAAPALPDYLKKEGITQEYWDAHPNLWLEENN
jgi:hypothetical protein